MPDGTRCIGIVLSLSCTNPSRARACSSFRSWPPRSALVRALSQPSWQQPKEHLLAVKPWDTCDGFIYVNLPEPAVEQFNVPVPGKAGYDGSSRDFHFTSCEADNGQHLNARDAPCGGRERPITPRPCHRSAICRRSGWLDHRDRPVRIDRGCHCARWTTSSRRSGRLPASVTENARPTLLRRWMDVGAVAT